MGICSSVVDNASSLKDSVVENASSLKDSVVDKASSLKDSVFGEKRANDGPRDPL